MAAQHTFSTLAGHNYLSLTTYRKNGQAVPTPVWFATAGNGTLYVVTSPVSGKAKRIRNNPTVTVAPCTARGQVLGPETSGTARFLEAEEASTAHHVLLSKYGWQFRVMDWIRVLQRKQASIFLEIAP